MKVLLDAPSFYTLLCTWEDIPYVLDQWQIEFLRAKNRFRACEKSVQIGFSFICALESLHRAFMFEDDTSVFVSYTEKDAAEKILFARKAYDGIPEILRRYVRVSKSSSEELFIGPKERPSRLVSRPATAGLRGIAGHVYLDEVDHYQAGQDSDVFTAAMGRIIRGDRRITIGSSVFGEATLLADLMSDEKYQDFQKFRLPWWVRTDPKWHAAIKQHRENMDPAFFAQEFECNRGAIAGATFSADMVRRSQNSLAPIDGSSLDSEATLIAGHDPGGDRNPFATTIIRLNDKGTWDQVSLEASTELSLAAQEAQLDYLLEILPRLTLAIDQLGVGHQMAQSLEKRWGKRRVKLVTFTAKTKPAMVAQLKRSMEDGQVTILRDRELVEQLQNTRLMAGGTVIQRGTVRQTHFDKFWSLAMAASAIQTKKKMGGIFHMVWGSEDDEDFDAFKTFNEGVA